MGWNPFRKRDRLEAGRRFRAQHSAWLTGAITSGRQYPSIPTRRVSDGGWAALMSRPGGSVRAERWWSLAFDEVDEI